MTNHKKKEGRGKRKERGRRGKEKEKNYETTKVKEEEDLGTNVKNVRLKFLLNCCFPY